MVTDSVRESMENALARRTSRRHDRRFATREGHERCDRIEMLSVVHHSFARVRITPRHARVEPGRPPAVAGGWWLDRVLGAFVTALSVPCSGLRQVALLSAGGSPLSREGGGPTPTFRWVASSSSSAVGSSRVLRLFGIRHAPQRRGRLLRPNTFAGRCSANFERHTAPDREPLQRENGPFVRFSFPHVAHRCTSGSPRIHHDLSTVRPQFVRFRRTSQRADLAIYDHGACGYNLFIFSLNDQSLVFDRHAMSNCVGRGGILARTLPPALAFCQSQLRAHSLRGSRLDNRATRSPPRRASKERRTRIVATHPRRDSALPRERDRRRRRRPASLSIVPRVLPGARSLARGAGRCVRSRR